MLEKINNYNGNVVVTHSIDNLNIYNNDVPVYDKESYFWDPTLGNGIGYFFGGDRQKEVLSHKKEMDWLNAFLDSPGCIRITAITGSTGTGKTSLAYYFYDKLMDSDWNVKAVKAEMIRFTQVLVVKANEKVLLILDYILPYARKLGQWIKEIMRVYENSKDRTVRILVIERSKVEDRRIPFWYKMLVTEYRLDAICDYRNFWNMERLSCTDIKKFFNYYMQMNGDDSDRHEYAIKSDQIINDIAEDCRYPVFVLMICEAWLNDGERRVRQWNRKYLLDYVYRKEEERISGLIETNTERDSLKRILAYSMALPSMASPPEAPSYLEPDFKLLQKNVGQIKSVLKEYGLESGFKTPFTNDRPEVIREFLFIQYMKELFSNCQDDAVDLFINAAWQDNPREYGHFLCRVIEDFKEDEVVNIEGILRPPARMGEDQREYYADLLREHTYWNWETREYNDKIIGIFDRDLLHDSSEEIKRDIAVKFAVALFNMIWNVCESGKCQDRTELGHIVLCIEQLSHINQEYNTNGEDRIIKMAYNGALVKMKNKKIIPALYAKKMPVI